MKMLMLAFSALLAGTAPALAADKFGEDCSGTETIQIGTQAPATMPYALAFSADLDSGSYCYGECGRDQTYPIADPRSDPLKLADADRGDQIRHLIFDRVSSRLTDYQVFGAGLGRIVRKASATCKPAAFRPPWVSGHASP